MTTPAATIYLARNTMNGHTYVGVTRFTVKHRWGQHVTNARRPKTYLQRAISKYGKAAFAVEAVASCLTLANAGDVERDVIAQWRPDYNQTNGGEIVTGRKFAPEVIERMRLKATGRSMSPKDRQANSDRAKARWASPDPEFRRKVLAGLAKGRANTNPAKRIAAVSAARKGRQLSPEWRAKISAACMGRRYSQDIIARMAATKQRPVQCIDTGVVYESVSMAAVLNDLSISGVSSVCRGVRTRANGLSFRFV